jgi:hypothetical protein
MDAEHWVAQDAKLRLLIARAQMAKSCHSELYDILRERRSSMTASADILADESHHFSDEHRCVIALLDCPPS